MSDQGRAEGPEAALEPLHGWEDAVLHIAVGEGGGGDLQLLAAPPIQAFRRLGLHEAWMLAHLPRKRADDPTSTPLACALTAVIPAAVSIVQAFSFNPFRFALDFVGVIEVAIFVGCVAWFINELRHQTTEQTSLAYLEELKTGIKVPIQPRPWWKIWGD